MNDLKKNIVIIEDNEDIRLGFRLLINSTPNYHVVDVFDSIEEAYLKTIDLKPDIILMDIDLPGMNGIDGTAKIKQKLPKTEIIIITIFENSNRVFNALCSGATGYLTKNINHIELLDALDEVSRGGAPMSANIARMIVGSFARNNDTPLTEKETEVLIELANGKSYKSIAVNLSISIDTVKFHIKNIYSKLQVNNKEDAIHLARNNKWL